ncbi:MAG: glycosyltransferase [Helicobacteraceae bacterium]|jgi:glycosyltransferase involved in cell wall biosynthesis|nr:glycosyltransferase [Helicobacteraceae bacterium]
MNNAISKPKVSAIIPVYNAEKYLRKCVESVLAQTFCDFECLLVDDKSSDTSGAICDEFALLDSRVRVMHNSQNEGASYARKIGLDAALGEYILFIDGDDWIEPQMIAALYSKAVPTDADMVYCDYYEEKEQERILKRADGSCDKIEAIKRIINGHFPIHVVLWNKLVKKDIYNKVDFPKD